MRRFVWLAVLAAGALAGVAAAGDPKIGKFVSYDTGDFVVVTSRSGSQARQVIEDLAKFRATLERLLNRRATLTSIPTQILIVSESDWHKYLEPREQLAGVFQRGNFANYITMNGDAERWAALTTSFHEYTHYYLSSQFPGEYPPWFNEGLAEVMAYTKFTNDGKAVLQIPMFQVYEARDKDWTPFERLIKISHDSPEYQSHKLNGSFYAQAWLTVHYGLLENREFGKHMMDYLQQLNTLHPIDEAAANTFGDLAATDQLLRDYSRNTHMNSGSLTLGAIPEIKLPEPKPMSEADALAAIVNTQIEMRIAQERVRPLLELLARREPESARPHILAARLALEVDDAASFEKEANAAEAAMAPGDWRQRRDLASVLLESADGSLGLSGRASDQTDRDLARAYKWSAEGLVHTNSDIELLWQFGTSATRLNKNLDLAEQALVGAYRRAPTNAQIAASLASLKSRQDDIEGMIPYLEDTERFANNLGMRRWATTTLADMRAYLVERKRVDDENRKEREEYEKKMAEYEKKYGKVKKKKPGA